MDSERVIPFEELIQRVRMRDEQAATELVRTYAPFIRRCARNRMRTVLLRRVLDSVDVCQSVLASLFNRASLGQYQLDTPEQLEKLLVQMVQNKVIDAWRRYSVRILGIDGIDLRMIPDQAPAPDEEVCLNELTMLVHARLTSEELLLLKSREGGISWIEIARQHNSTAEALRKKLARALRRIAVY